jgi:hypothetical protein
MTDSGLCRLVVVLVVLLTAWVGPAAAQDDPLRIGRVTIDNGDIFSGEEVDAVGGAERLLRRTMNGLHIRTRDHVLRRELLFAPGDVYEPERLAETERNLRNLGYLNSVSVVAVDTLDDGTVDVLVRARDSWSLQATFAWSLASGGDQRWQAKLSERNFLGYGFTLGAGVGGDEDRNYWNAFYRQRRLFGGAVGAGLDISQSEDGHFRGAFLQRPFHAQDDPWAGVAQGWDSQADQRWYLSNAGPAGADPEANASLHALLPRHERGGELNLLVRIGPHDGRRFWRFGGGVRLTETSYTLGGPTLLSDGRVEDLSWLRGPDGAVTRDEGRKVYAYAAVQTVGRNWTKARFVMQYGPVEDILLSPYLDLRVGPAGGQTGSTTGWGEDVWRAEGVLTRWWHHGRSHVLARAVGLLETGSDRVERRRGELVLGWLGQTGPANTPWLGRVFLEGGRGTGLGGTDALLLGLDRGLRTLEFDGMAGDRLVRWNAELGKVSPWEILGLFRMGGAVFYGGGRAWWHDEASGTVGPRHEAGLGLRFGPLRTANSEVARLDLTWALDGSVGPVLTAATGGTF